MKTNRVEQASMRPHIWARCVLWEAAADHLTCSSKAGSLPNANDSKCEAHGTEAQTTKYPPPRAAAQRRLLRSRGFTPLIDARPCLLGALLGCETNTMPDPDHKGLKLLFHRWGDPLNHTGTLQHCPGKEGILTRPPSFRILLALHFCLPAGL